ncbi:MAG: thiL, partial [Novosphingobium sp.]|nr:thiL [Novosphingobium sp.]
QNRSWDFDQEEGLLDAARLARASGVTLAIDRAAVPIATPEDRRDEALRWGDDYQLLFTAPATVTLPIATFRIGEAIAAKGAPILLDGIALTEADNLGYEHR